MGKLFNSPRRHFSAKQKINIVFCAYGSIKDFRRQLAGPSQVAGS